MDGGSRFVRARCRKIERRRIDRYPVAWRTHRRCAQAQESRMTPPPYADLPGVISMSFEFFPPKSPAMEETLWQSIQTLEPLSPRFVSDRKSTRLNSSHYCATRKP